MRPIIPTEVVTLELPPFFPTFRQRAWGIVCKVRGRHKFRRDGTCRCGSWTLVQIWPALWLPPIR